MKNNYSKILFISFLLTTSGSLFCSMQAATPEMQEGKKQDPEKTLSEPLEYGNRKGIQTLVINGANPVATFTLETNHLADDQPVTLKATAGFTVSPEMIPANNGKTKVTITLNSSKPESYGQIIIRSGDTRQYVNLVGYGAPLPTKDISGSPVYANGTDTEFERTIHEGFRPTANGYTIEFRVKTNDPGKEFQPYVVDKNGIGFKAWVNSTDMGLYSGNSKKEFRNPQTSIQGGLGKFYNDDDRYHTYRYAVAPDNRLFIYRDGLLIKIVRPADYGNQANFAGEVGDPVENLLKNPDFEGEFDYTEEDGTLTKDIEGWDIIIGDKYNSEQYIVRQEIDNELGMDNQILQMKRYKWADGWSAGLVKQIVDVVPNETYTLSALARGGIKNDGNLLGQIQIEEVQDTDLKISTEITGNLWETYSLDYTTSENCNQIAVVFYLERDKWGADITPLEVDNVKLTGKSRVYIPKIGFNNNQCELEYFTYDLSGAYAPKQPEITIAVGKK